MISGKSRNNGIRRYLIIIFTFNTFYSKDGIKLIIPEIL